MADYRRYQDYNYIEGNAVRKLNPSYEPEIQRPVKKEPASDPKRNARIQKNRDRVNVIDAKYALVIACACMMVFAACVGYLKTQAKISDQRSKIVSLQSELNQINNENVAVEEALNSSVDLNAIYQTASEKLGMKYADTKHTIVYESSDPDYVRQYQDIPENK